MDTISSFLASIGYVLSEPEAKQFDEAIEKVDAFGKKLTANMGHLARAFRDMVVGVTQGFATLALRADRAGAELADLSAMAYVAQQTGASGQSMVQAIEAFGVALRHDPGFGYLIRKLGVRTNDGSAWRGTVDVFLDTIDKLNSEDSQRASIDAKMLGIPGYAYFRTMGGRFRSLIQEDRERAKKFGLAPNTMGEQSLLFVRGVALLQLRARLILDLLVSRLGGPLTDIIDRLDAWITKHQSQISEAAKALTDTLIAVAPAFGDLLIVLYQIGVWLDKIIHELTGQSGLTIAIEGLGGAFLVFVGVRAILFNRLLVGALLSIIALFAGKALYDKIAGEANTPGLSTATRGTAAGFVGQAMAVGRNAYNWAARKVGLPEIGAKGAGPDGSGLNRSRFREELNDPAVRARLFAMTEAEEGSEGRSAEEQARNQQAFMEETMNRAAARHKTIAEILFGKDGYFPATTLNRAAAAQGSLSLDKKYGPMLEQVLRGSNVANFATGNESGGVHSGGAPVVFQSGNERGVIELPDLPWARRAIERAKERLQIIEKAKEWDRTHPGERPDYGPQKVSLISSPWGDTSSTSVSRATEITVHGDKDSHKTAAEVTKTQMRINSDLIQVAAVA